MENKETKKCGCSSQKNGKVENAAKAIDNLPGVAIDVADDEIVTKADVKERTKTLDNNPRDSTM